MRNTWVICREVRNNLLKGKLMPDVIVGKHFLTIKARLQDPTLHDKPAAYQLVGEVMAHQG